MLHHRCRASQVGLELAVVGYCLDVDAALDGVIQAGTEGGAGDVELAAGEGRDDVLRLDDLHLLELEAELIEIALLDGVPEGRRGERAADAALTV